MKIKNLKQTCKAVPSQWEGTMQDGQSLYVRYRNGAFRVDINKKTFHARTIGTRFDGYLEQSKMLDILKDVGFEIDETSEIGEEMEVDWDW